MTKEKELNSEEKESFIQMLVALVFDKVKKESKRSSINGLVTYLRDELKCQISDKTLERLYKGYILGRKKDKKTPQQYSLDTLSIYLGFTSFVDFQEKNEKEKERVKRIIALILLEEKCKKNTMKYRIGVLFFAGMFLFITLKHQERKCMIWVGDHFEKIKCSGIKNEENLDPVRLKEFKQVYYGKCDTFFLWDNPQNPIIWYDKSNNKVTLFTAPGIHPTNGKTLKPITQTIIDNHIEPCP